ncbi:hypothetical protein Tsubulata_015326 [Turnera subulata]|uniref:RPM1 interacting protein 13 n=1 Tax=Turnera subulata TaxID=218843 RepID=A0A9Q0JBQ6_9ROSI|nr:hypothetical protein Tsubulata_015326 [Turnera subulata]
MGETKGGIIDDGVAVIELSPTTPLRSAYSLSSSPDDTPLRPIFVLKRNMDDLSQFDESEDCFILDFDPFDSIQGIGDLSVSADSPPGNEEDISLVAEKGQVACRDYPHSRHLCVKYPFGTTDHEQHCKLCYCYVCDTAAPCKYWENGKSGHCNASGDKAEWKLLRQSRRQQPPILQK